VNGMSLHAIVNGMESTVFIRSGDPAVNRCNRALGVANLQDELRDEIKRA